ncbi:putative mariner transposase [Trichonephila clavipes]|nr:putative mariner transposase [Trichonephila clavipes]
MLNILVVKNLSCSSFFFYINGIITVELVPQDQMMTHQYYIESLRMFRERLRKKRPDLQSNNTWILHQHNASMHIALSAIQFLADKSITGLYDPPYSPNLAMFDFFLFLKVKNALIRTHFQYGKEVKTKMADLLKMVTTKEAQHCFERPKIRMQLCIDRKREYIEGNCVHCFQ